MDKLINYLKKYYDDIFILLLSGMVFISLGLVLSKLTNISTYFFKGSFIVLLIYFVIKVITNYIHKPFKESIKSRESILLISILLTSLIMIITVLVKAPLNKQSISLDYLTRCFLVVSTLIFIYIAVTTKINKLSIKIITFMDIALAVLFILGFAIGFARGKTSAGYSFNFGNPNTTAQVLVVIASLLIIGIFLFNKLWISIIYLALAIVMIVFLFLTGSRTGMLSLFGGLVFMIILIIKKKINAPKLTTVLLYVLIPLFIVVIYVPIFYLLTSNNALTTSGIIASFYTRYEVWTDGFKSIIKHPMFGDYQMYQTYANYDQFHNIFVDTWAQYGLLPLLGLIFIFTWSIKITLDKYKLDSFYNRIIIAILFMTLLTGIGEVAIINSTNGSYILELLPLIFIKEPISDNKTN